MAGSTPFFPTMEYPKSPWRMFPSHLRYCTGMGSSSPYFLINLSAASGVLRASGLFIYEARSLSGPRAQIIEKIIKVTPISMSGIKRSLLIM